jgi:hypothetical protein
MAAPTSLRVYSSREYLPEGSPHVVALYSLWGPAAPLPWPEPDFADAFVASNVFVPAELGAADIAVFPQDWKHTIQDADGLERATSFIEAARAAGTRPVFFWASDSDAAFPFADAFVFRPSLFRSRRREHEFALPGFHEDLLRHTGGALRLRPWQSRPTLGFAGYAPPPPVISGTGAHLRHAVGNARRAAAIRAGRPLGDDIFVRRRALDVLSAQDGVGTNIVLRDEQTGLAAFFPHYDPDLWSRLRAEYVANMLDSDYVLCTRGNGNYSYRLTEALSLGRIPVFVDTDCVLPYDFTIDWPGHGLWLGRRDVPSIAARILDFHARLTPDEFADLQRRGRALWEEYLSPLGYFSNFGRHFSV